MTKLSKSSEKSTARIEALVGQLNDIARAQVEFMAFFPPLADQIPLGLADYLGEEGCAKLSNNQDEFSFEEQYGHDGLGVEGGRFRIPVMVRIRDHNSCESAEQSGVSEAEDGQPKEKTKKSKVKAAAAQSGKTKKSKKAGTIKEVKKASKSFKSSKNSKISKAKKALKKSKKKRAKQQVLAEKDNTASDCSETFLRFKLLFERKQGKLIVDIAGTKKITVDIDNLEPLYEAIFVYLKAYFSVEKFFDNRTESYQNASYGFFRKEF